MRSIKFPMFIFLMLAWLHQVNCVTLDASNLFDRDKMVLNDLLPYFLTCDSCFSGPPLPATEKWTLETDPCLQWHGIGCTEVGGIMTVTSLAWPPHYSHDSMNPFEIPSPIQNLTNLTILDLSVPPGYGSCKQYNVFPEWIGKLTNLEVIDMRRNAIHSIPFNLQYLHKLRELYLGSNKIYMFPNDLSGLVRLQTLDMSRNEMYQFPSFIRGLTSMSALNVSVNTIFQIPEWLIDLEALTILDISHCSFSGPIPAHVRSIQHVYMADSGYEGSLFSCTEMVSGTCVAAPFAYQQPVPGYYLEGSTCDAEQETLSNSSQGSTDSWISLIVGIIVVGGGIALICCCFKAVVVPRGVLNHSMVNELAVGNPPGDEPNQTAVVAVTHQGCVICIGEVSNTPLDSDSEEALLLAEASSRK